MRNASAIHSIATCELTGTPCDSFEGATISIKRLVGDELASKVSPIWNLNEEGEQNGAWRWLGVPNLWFMMGMLSILRGSRQGLTPRCRQPGDVQIPLETPCAPYVVQPSLCWLVLCSQICAEIKAIQEGVYGKRYAPE